MDYIYIPLQKNGYLESMNLPFQKKWSLHFQGDENSWTFPNERFLRDLWWRNQAELHLRNQRITLQSLGAQDGGCDDMCDAMRDLGTKKNSEICGFVGIFLHIFGHNLREFLGV